MVAAFPNSLPLPSRNILGVNDGKAVLQRGKRRGGQNREANRAHNRVSVDDAHCAADARFCQEETDSRRKEEGRKEGRKGGALAPQVNLTAISRRIRAILRMHCGFLDGAKKGKRAESVFFADATVGGTNGTDDRGRHRERMEESGALARSRRCHDN